MEREALIQKLLVLSEKHHHVAVEENWEQWERIMREKERVWKSLAGLHSGLNAEREVKPLQAIAQWEERTRKELTQKCEETKGELMRIKRLKEALKGYRMANAQDSPRHFRVVC
jgi:hypothetical protein